MKSALSDRNLWYDGTVEVSPDSVENLFLLSVPVSKIAVNCVNSDIQTFNELSTEHIGVKIECNPLRYEWLIPEKYSSINIDEYVDGLKKSVNMHDVDYDRRMVRIDNELSEFKRRNLIMLLKTIIYITDTLKEKDILWGVGRGSSCASYILYLIGLHCVDPVRFNISMNEFLHD